MTKKHFEAFAREIRESARDREQKAAMAWLIIRVASDDNPRFNRERFLKACGLD